MLYEWLYLVTAAIRAQATTCRQSPLTAQYPQAPLAEPQPLVHLSCGAGSSPQGEQEWAPGHERAAALRSVAEIPKW